MDKCRKQFDTRFGLREGLDGSYPYECGSGKIAALHTEYNHNGKRLFYGDTIV